MANDDRKPLSEIELSQAELRECIEQSKRLAEESEQLLNQQRKAPDQPQK